MSELRDTPSAVERILFDPVSYIHPGRVTLPDWASFTGMRAALNDMIIDAYGLSVGWRAMPSSAERCLIDTWPRLIDVCELIGAQLLKAELTWAGRQMTLPRRIRTFVAASGGTPARSDGTHRRALRTSGMATVQAAGIDHVMAWQQASAPALRERVALMFAPETDRLTSGAPSSGSADIFLIHRAIQYAKNHPAGTS
ncbi:hypothetical protein K6W16_19995 [Burkholderia dolosa]|uniref:Oxygen-regulated invasion protein OrgA n=1 Tax=Burkholderia dolosa TaxID=152500 RepID=A0A892I612_9BURK|nr:MULTISPECIES: hypothetical protein [Burkholderia]AJY09263.1 bacterial type III secretion apparatus family protein [Burkholderia dolosa AU0158]AYZ94372.1 hypothetical protein EGY28_04435 [Burkholderia dolosa]ETP63863.1 hypothetical protein BDSB_25650 [Burkholderia dolosa PC543]MBR8415780.1 hypothetical protein [Burkholderia dolosa]MBY4659575.1 hypothetical protein [Burkholderia dolosa]